MLHSFGHSRRTHAQGDRWLLVEIKMTAGRQAAVEGERGVKAKALQALEAANPGRIFYRMVFADAVAPAPDVACMQAFADLAPTP